MKFLKRMISNDLIIPHPLTTAVGAVTPLVAQFRELGHAELEVRLGRADPTTGEWMVGLTEPTFTEILTMFLKYAGWDNVTAWSDSHDYMYTVNSATIRTSVKLDTSMQISHIIKQRIDTVELRLRNFGRARVALMTETPVCAKMLPETVTPHLVRLKKRRSFTRGPWRFDLTRVWSGATRSGAEMMQSGGECTYEVEVEFVPEPEYWDEPKHTFTYIATSLLMKMVDVLSDEMIGCEVLP